MVRVLCHGVHNLSSLSTQSSLCANAVPICFSNPTMHPGINPQSRTFCSKLGIRNIQGKPVRMSLKVQTSISSKYLFIKTLVCDLLKWCLSNCIMTVFLLEFFAEIMNSSLICIYCSRYLHQTCCARSVCEIANFH